jgi:hypothetical protein
VLYCMHIYLVAPTLVQLLLAGFSFLHAPAVIRGKKRSTDARLIKPSCSSTVRKIDHSTLPVTNEYRQSTEQDRHADDQRRVCERVHSGPVSLPGLRVKKIFPTGLTLHLPPSVVRMQSSRLSPPLHHV